MTPTSKPWFHPALTPVQRTNRIGEEIYPKIQALLAAETEPQPAYITAGRITGMFIELPLKEADALLDSDARMKAAYEKAKAKINTVFGSK